MKNGHSHGNGYAMRIRSGALIVALFTGAFLTAASPLSPGREFDSLLAQCRPGTSHDTVVNWCHEHGFDLRPSYSKGTGLEILAMGPGHDLDQSLTAAQASGLFEYVEPDLPLQLTRFPNDQGLRTGQAWGLQNTGQRLGLADADIDAPEAWDIRTSAESVIVAVIDSGIRYTHEDLVGNLWHNPDEIPDNGRDDDQNGLIDDEFGFNAVRHSGDPWDDDGHGTSVSGVIGAEGNNRLGIAGVAWNVQIMALKFLEQDGQGLTSDAISCIDYALAHGANVINASWGGNGRSRSLERAIRRALAQDVLFVTAAGNDGADIDQAPDYPASYSLSNIITVGSTTRFDRASSASNFGTRSVDLFAPGSQIYTCSAASDHSYGFASGTSLAAPFVTGALALMIASDPQLSGFELTEQLLSTVDPLPTLRGLSQSGGRLNLASALELANPNAAPITATQPRLRLVSTQTGLTLDLTAAPGQAFLLQASVDLTTWRSTARLQGNEEGFARHPLTDETQDHRFFRVVPLQ